LPGKPLRLIAGRPMIEHVWRRATEAGADEVLVATDDDGIRDVVEHFGGHAVMTSPDHPSGTDRLAEVAAQLGWPDDAVVVNLQGDEPCMDPAAVRRVAALLDEPDAGMATLATPIREPADLFDPAVVKVVIDAAGNARWFSRAPIPWVRGHFAPGSGPPAALPPGMPFLRHLGLYAYRVGILRQLCATPPQPYETAEALEQLRALVIGVLIRIAVLDNDPGHGVDTEADLARAERELARLTDR
jgi:3-deoxy-manno-octulosonate cytidylyltransferase (CMP-KDO synthetase)